MAVWDDVIGQAEQAAYERAGWGGEVGLGESPALIVVDMYRAFVDPMYPYAASDARATARRIRRVLDVFRDRRLPVWFSTAASFGTAQERGRWKTTATTESELMRRPEAYEICDELAPLPGEPVLVKAYPSAFFGTTLISQLVYRRVDTVVVTGTVTSGCVRGTCLDAFNYNFRVIVPEDCVCDRGPTSHKVALFEIHMKYGDVMTSGELLARLDRADCQPAGANQERLSR